MFIVKQTKHGMQGRLLLFQEHPFEVQSNYAGSAALRCNFDVQDLRRVLPEAIWNPTAIGLPSLGVDGNRSKEMGYQGNYEWDGEAFVERFSGGELEQPLAATSWDDELTREEWREVFLAALQEDVADEVHPKDCDCMACDCFRASIAAFGDAINTGFYVNSYTTKQCPTMEGVLDNLRQGLARLEEQRQKEQEELESKRRFVESTLCRDLTKDELKPFKGKTVFQETMRTLNRLNSSYRRCYWKSGAEMIFPILYGHMTFASHRCWTVYVKKAVFQAVEAWRRMYGSSIRHAAIKAGGGEIIQHFRQGYDPHPLPGWRWVEEDGVYENSSGRRCATTHEIYESFFATTDDCREQLTFLQKFLNDCCAEKLPLAEDDCRQIVTTSPLDDWLWRGDNPIVKDMSWYVYSMWVYRVETLPLKLDKNSEPLMPSPRFIDIDFSPDYKLHRTHKQRIATEFRVPLYEGFTMPSSYFNSETAAMYKSLLLRSLSVEVNDEPEDVRFASAFRPSSAAAG